MKDVAPLYRKFWSAFDEIARQESELINSGTVVLVGDRDRMNRGARIGFGARARLELLINVHHYPTPKGTGAGMPPKSIAMGLRIDEAIAGHTPDELVAILDQDKHAIHSKIGCPLDWPDPAHHTPQKRQVILLVNRGSDPADETHWPAQHQWLLRKIEMFHDVFVPRLEALQGE